MSRKIAMILAGGVGSRVGADRPKQFVEVLGKPVLAYTIEIYERNPQIDSIEVVCHSMWREYLTDVIEQNNFKKVKYIVDGGNTYQESVMNGMNFLNDKISDDDIVMIHYGAAPFTDDEIINDNIKVCEEHGMAASCIPCFQLLASNDGEKCCSWIDRDKIVQLTCPQSFRYAYLKDIYVRAEKKGLLDTIEPHTTSLMFALGDHVFQSYGNQNNIKITTKSDFDLFEGYVMKKQKDANN